MKKLLFFAFSSILYSNFAFTQSARLDREEVKVLKEIKKKLGISGLDFDKDGSRHEGDLNLYVGCDCSFESNTTCRVTNILIRFQNVSTTLPSEFSKLRYLQILDLSYNYLKGTVPSEWATMRLSTLLLMGNRLSGLFPRALTRVTTLLNLSIEGNSFSGPIPKEIANLKILEKLALSSNDFTGQLPVALAKLTNLTDLRISDNSFTGKIPNYISHWTKIETLHILGCSFEGPFPSSISALKQLNDLRISDLKGGRKTFPSVEKMLGLNILVLRNCLIHGTIPDIFGNLRSLITLDLSFNNLTGNIPSSFSLLENAEYIYLTKNNLTGPMPGWILSSTKAVDVSYNHFTWDDASGPKRCELGMINVVESYSSSTNKQNIIHPCLRKDFPCTKSNAQQIRSLHINCGGEDVNINSTIKYEADTERRGASSYYIGDSDPGAYIFSNTSNLYHISTFDTELYTKARTAALSYLLRVVSYERELYCQTSLCRDCFHPR